METKSAKMSHQRRQRANPRKIEGSADPLDGREAAGSNGCDDFWLGGSRVTRQHFRRIGYSRIQKPISDDSRIGTTKKHQNFGSLNTYRILILKLKELGGSFVGS